MKRDLNLSRDILFYIEEEHDPEEGVLQFTPDNIPEELEEDHSGAVVMRHLELLWDAGFVEVQLPKNKAHVRRNAVGSAAIIAVRGLTHDGHEFLDEIRSNEVLETTMDKVSTAVGSASLAVVREVARGVTKEMIRGA